MLEEIMNKLENINYGYLYEGMDIYPHKEWNKKFNEIYIKIPRMGIFYLRFSI